MRTGGVGGYERHRTQLHLLSTDRGQSARSSYCRWKIQRPVPP